MLTLDYRPVRFHDVAGQESARLILQSLVSSGDIPPSLLFTGSSGIGKTSMARILAAALNCPNAELGDCCGECSSCLAVQSNTSLAVQEIDSATNGGVDEIRSLKDLATFTVMGGSWRVIILDEAHCLSRQAFNALLKVLEEPPTHTVFALLTTEPDKILSTVQSRSMPVHFRPLSSAVVMKRLSFICEQEKFAVPEMVISEIAESAEGGMRDAIRLLDLANRTGVQSLDSLHALTGKTDIPSRIIASLINQNVTQAVSLVDEFFSTSSDVNHLVNGMMTEVQSRFAQFAIPTSRVIAATKLLWDARAIRATNLRSVKTHAEALVILLHGVFLEESKPQVARPILRVEESQKSGRLLSGQELAAIEF